MDDSPLKTIDFDNVNTLEPVFSNASGDVTGLTGQFAGRKEGLYRCQHTGNSIFAIIILGAFELQNWLLEKGDALSLLNVAEVEFEALSNGAIILLMEVGMR